MLHLNALHLVLLGKGEFPKHKVNSNEYFTHYCGYLTPVKKDHSAFVNGANSLKKKKKRIAKCSLVITEAALYPP